MSLSDEFLRSCLGFSVVHAVSCCVVARKLVCNSCPSRQPHLPANRMNRDHAGLSEVWHGRQSGVGGKLARADFGAAVGWVVDSSLVQGARGRGIFVLLVATAIDVVADGS